MDTNSTINGPDSLISTFAGMTGVLVLLSYIFNTYFSEASRKWRRLPPGPKPKLFIGNLFDLPPPNTEVAPHYLKLGKTYGPIISLRILGQTMIVINDYGIVRDLLDKRSSKYSNRPTFTFAGQLAGYDRGIPFSPANDDFRQMRKFAHSQIGSPMVLKNWHKDIDLETKRYLLRVLERPSDRASHIQNEASSIVLKILYGYQTDPSGTDPLVELIGQVMHEFSDAALPGKWACDFFPVLKHIPAWFPGIQFPRIAKQYRNNFNKALNLPYDFAKNHRSQRSDSLVTRLLRQGDNGQKLSEHQEELLQQVAFSLYSGGADTTVCTMETFYLAMIKFPAVLAIAQAEIDQVLGSTCLPDEHDRANLPYCEAVVKETLRWQPVADIAMPHVNPDDDEYKGYFIPKGSLIMPNFTAITRDPNTHIDPDEFKPERFLGDSAEKDVHGYIWGFGKRICPGRFLATANLWLEISRTIACFDIRSVEGEEPSGKYTIGFLRRPQPFKAHITVRSPAWEALIREVETNDPLPQGDARYLP